MTIQLANRFVPLFSGSAMLSGERLLIVEGEFLIALEIQRVLEDANAQQAVFTRNFDEVLTLTDRLAEFDLAIVTPPRPHTADQSIFDRLVSAELAIVVCSAIPDRLARTEISVGEFVSKPFRDDDLLAACRRAIARRAKS